MPSAELRLRKSSWAARDVDGSATPVIAGVAKCGPLVVMTALLWLPPLLPLLALTERKCSPANGETLPAGGDAEAAEEDEEDESGIGA
jgi:hypothetical protein